MGIVHEEVTFHTEYDNESVEAIRKIIRDQCGENQTRMLGSTRLEHARQRNAGNSLSKVQKRGTGVPHVHP